MVVLAPPRGETLEKLIKLADGNIDLVRRVIDESAVPGRSDVDLLKVVKYIQANGYIRNNSSNNCATLAGDVKYFFRTHSTIG